SRRRHTRSKRDWSSDVCSSDLHSPAQVTLDVRAITVLARDHLNGCRVCEEPSFRFGDELLGEIIGVDGRKVQTFRVGNEPRSVRSEERRVGKEGRSGWWEDGWM